MRRIILFMAFIGSCDVSIAQRDFNWVFGDSVGLSFLQGLPIVQLQPVLCSFASSASISDEYGNLLFYAGASTNYVTPDYYKIKIWNKYDQIMPDGDELYGSSPITQGTMIVPLPDDTAIYYVFTLRSILDAYYSIVDMRLDSGRGDVVMKNIQLNTNGMYVSQKMHAVKHGNGRDWWVLIHNVNAGNTFIRYLLTPYGISGPLMQSIGTSIPDWFKSFGQMKFSNSGNKLCMVGNHWMIDLFDFDRCTGLLSNYIQLGDSTGITGTGISLGDYYGCSYSPNDSILYVSNSDTLFQYDLYATNIQLSKQVIFSSSCTDTCYLGQHQIAPNGLIYIANYGGQSWSSTSFYNWANMSISYIENPNALGTPCNFNYLGQYLGGRRSLFGLPNMVNYNLGPLVGSPCDTLLGVTVTNAGNHNFTITPNPATTHLTLQYSPPKTAGVATVFNATGSKVSEIILPKGSHTMQLDISQYPSGLYLLKIETESYTGAKKFVRE